MINEIAITDINGIRIARTENAKSESGMRAGVDVRGGGPASRKTELLNPLTSAEMIHAVVISGGSAFGLCASIRSTKEFIIQNKIVRENKFVSNTTLGVVITNAKFTKSQLCKISGMSLNGYARSIKPLNTSADGDTVYALYVGDHNADMDFVGTLAADGTK